MGKDNECACKEKHQGHICVLLSKGLSKEVKHLASNPNAACLRCGAEADSEDHVCIPVPLFI